VTGIAVSGSAGAPVIYIASSDPRIGGGESGGDTNLDTNSGVLSKLTKSGGTWTKVDLVRGLPRSEENHTANGLALSLDGQTLYIAQGGNTNKGAPSNNFAKLPEFALSAAILSVDLSAVQGGYDLPTLDDETRAGASDIHDPFGGNSGKNQAKVVPNGPVQVYAPGFRNAYDVVVTAAGKMFSIDNGGNAQWGDVPVGEGPAGTCTNGIKEPGTTERDSLHAITGKGYYGGHPNPTRANTANTFNTSNPQSPVSAGNAIECDFQSAGDVNGAGKDEASLVSFGSSTNGLAEYTASNFGGAMKGNLLAASFDGTIQRLVTSATSATKQAIATGIPGPLDVTALGDTGTYPGPSGSPTSARRRSTSSSRPTSAGHTAGVRPHEGRRGRGRLHERRRDRQRHRLVLGGQQARRLRQRQVSDLTDANDDNDALADVVDPFARDKDNGLTTPMPVSYLWENEASAEVGGFFGLGFTGLMTNGKTDYLQQFDAEGMTTGGAAGVVTVDEVDPGDAFGPGNSQRYGFQFGVKARPTDGPFTVSTRIVGPFKGVTPEDYQSMGLFLGTGDQDNYVKITTAAVGGTGIQVGREVAGVATSTKTPLVMPGPDAVDLFLTVDPQAGTVQPSYMLSSDGAGGPEDQRRRQDQRPDELVHAADRGLAVGIISTSNGPGAPFAASWDFMKVTPEPQPQPSRSRSPSRSPSRSRSRSRSPSRSPSRSRSRRSARPADASRRA
jgi:hypothetical protein